MNQESIIIKLPIAPLTATAQQKGVFVRGGRAHFYTKAKVREAEQTYASLLAPYRPQRPIESPVSVDILFAFPYRKSEKKAHVKKGAILAHTTRPDLDNLEKGLLDTMTKLGFWSDDSLVFEKRTKKIRFREQFVEIVVTPREEVLAFWEEQYIQGV